MAMESGRVRARIETTDRPRRRGLRASEDRRVEAAERRRLRQDLDRATARAAFVLHYQPRLRLGSGEPAGAEALLRWPHRKRGMVPPAAFIPLAEEYGQITAIGGWAMATACLEAQSWRGGVVSVNISGRQLRDGALLAQVAAALEVSDLIPERLELELTESVLADTSLDMLLALSAVRDLGVGLALDDFGMGFASLAMLKRLPLTMMKLDRALIRDLPRSHEDAAIVRAVIATGHALGLSIVAEGIETEEQRAFLAGCGCDEGQGYLFSEPLPAAQIRAQMEAGG